MQKKRLLFVDDEPLVLQGLQRLLRAMRDEWEMVFVDSGQKGLEALDGAPFDMVVSDMRMPGMNGAEFLNLVMERHPQTIRVVLSGYADQDLMLRCVGATHQYLSKPCDPEQLKSLLRNACLLGRRVDDQKLKEVLSRIGRLPSMSSVYLELTAVLKSERATSEEIAAVIAKDVGLMANILKLVNSAFFGLGRSIASAEDAVSYLGTEIIRSLVLVRGLFDQVASFRIGSFTQDVLWAHCLQVGALAQKIARAEHGSKVLVEECFTAGLLHDVGVLIMASQLPEEYGEVLARIQGKEEDFFTAERQILGVDHGGLGAYVMGLWGLPERVVDAIAWHHIPRQQMANLLTPTIAVHAADVLAGGHAVGTPFERAKADLLFLESIGFKKRWESWKESAAPYLEGRDES